MKIHLKHPILALALGTALSVSAFAQEKVEKIPPTPEQDAIIKADISIPADQPGIKTDTKTTTPDGKPNPNFGKPATAFMNLHQANLERRKLPMDVLFVGDSITQGWTGKGMTVWKPLFEEPYKAADFGISGDRTQHVLWRIQEGELDGIKPKVVVLMIGTNNSAFNTPAQIAAGITRIVEQIKAKIPGVKVLLLNVLPRSEKPTDARRQVVSQVNDIIMKLDNGSDIVYVRLWDPFLAEDGTLKKDLMPDFLHPNEAGYKIMGEAIQGKLKEMIPQ